MTINLETYIKNGIIEMEAITYIRGRSISNAFIMIDEAQNLTTHELKTILTRVGKHQDCINRDIEQIDNTYINETTNGLTYAVEKFKNEDLAGHIILQKGERSKVASSPLNYFKEKNELEENPTLTEEVESTNELKTWLVNYVGERVRLRMLEIENNQVTVQHIVAVMATDFPESLMQLPKKTGLGDIIRPWLILKRVSNFGKKSYLRKVKVRNVNSYIKSNLDSFSEKVLYNNIVVLVKDPLPESVSLDKVMHQLNKKFLST